MEALNRVSAELRVLACPEDSAEAFEPLAAEAGFVLFVGPKDDVLKRYSLAVRKHDIAHVIRATGDNPFVFTDAANSISEQAINLGADYAGYIGLPLGGGVEAINAKALLRAEKNADTPWEREHVCPYLYNHPKMFLLHRPLPLRQWQGMGMRLTVDIPEDYTQAQLLYEALDAQEKAGELPDGGRYKGAAIIAAYQKVLQKTGKEKSV